MTLYEYITSQEDGAEIEVQDKDYYIISYFYNDKYDNDEWQTAMMELSKLLNVEKIYKNDVMINMFELIKNKIDNLKNSDLFVRCKAVSIMEDMPSILSGNVSEEWLTKFVNALKS